MIGTKYADLGIIPHRFSAKDYHVMARLGIWSPEEGVELIAGRLYNLPVPGKGDREAAAELARLLLPPEREEWRVRAGELLQVGASDVFLPDLVLLKPSTRDRGFPTSADALLAIEIGDARMSGSDRELKLPRYALAGVPELWLVDPRQRLIARYDFPLEDDYGNLYTFKEHETITSVTLPAISLPVAAIFGASPVEEEGRR